MTIKKWFVLLIFLSVISVVGFAQEIRTISGTVTDEITRKPIEDAEISYGANIVSAYTNAQGVFWLKVNLDLGDKIYIMIKKDEEGYRLDKPIEYTIAKEGNVIAPDKTILKKKPVFAGHICTKDKETEELTFIKDATILYRERSELKEGGKSNDNGYFTFPINRKPGDKVEIQVKAKGYKSFLPDRLKEYTISNNGNLETIYLEPSMTNLEQKYIISGTVKNEKGNTIPNAKISYKLTNGGWEKVGQTDEDGDFSFPIYRELIEVVRIRIKTQGYKRHNEEYSILRGKEGLNITLIKEHDIPTKKEPIIDYKTKGNGLLTKCWFWTAISSGALLTTSFITGDISNKAYDKTMKIINPNREKDLKRANSFKRISATAFYGSLGGLVGGGICFICKKKKKKKKNSDSGSFQPIFGVPNYSGVAQVGFVYTF